MALKLSEELLQADIYCNSLDDLDMQNKQVGFDDENQAFTQWLNREVWDHDDELLLAKGWDLSVFDLNSVVMWAHNYDQKPLGTAQWAVRKLKEQPPGLLWRPQLTKETQEGIDTYKLIKARVLRAASAGFKPKEIDRESDKRGWIYIKMVLLEGSIVPVPANFMALTLALENDFIKSKMIKESLDDILSRTDSRLFQNDIPDKEIEYIEKSFGKMKENHKIIKKAKDNIWLEEIDNQKPYPNEHACRLKSPEGADRCFVNHVNDPDSKKPFDQIICYYGDKSGVQALRYKKDVWTVTEARSHCNKHEPINFEPATGESSFNDMRMKHKGYELDGRWCFDTEKGDTYCFWNQDDFERAWVEKFGEGIDLDDSEIIVDTLGIEGDIPEILVNTGDDAVIEI
jgi:HK97 family phage prohead protease